MKTQRRTQFLIKCGLTPLLLPNNLGVVKILVKNISLSGFLLTGGNSLAKYHGDAKERDQLEKWLITYGIKNAVPILGVCRGMQIIQDAFGVRLSKISGHVLKRQTITINSKKRNVNSYQCWGTKKSSPRLIPWAYSRDGIIKAVKHSKYPICGIMWHPERLNPNQKEDLILFKKFLGKK